MLNKENCFAYVSSHYCSATIRTDCIKCSFYKPKIKKDVNLKNNYINTKRFDIGLFKNKATKEENKNE